MLSFTSQGLLGNQLFQYASTRGIANHRGFDFGLPSAKSNAWMKDNQKIFQQKVPDAKLDERAWEFQLNYACDLPFRQDRKPGYLLHERQFNFDKKLFDNCPDNVVLWGHFQTERYFRHIGKEIKQELRFRSGIVKKATTPIPTGAVALHVRRGTNTDFHPELPLGYYRRALKEFPTQPIVIFTNAPDWVRKQSLFQGERFTLSEGMSNYADLYLMTKCYGHITANSSYGWWGAWLAESNKVVAPKEYWYNSLFKLNQTDLYPKDWIKV